MSIEDAHLPCQPPNIQYAEDDHQAIAMTLDSDSGQGLGEQNHSLQLPRKRGRICLNHFASPLPDRPWSKVHERHACCCLIARHSLSSAFDLNLNENEKIIKKLMERIQLNYIMVPMTPLDVPTFNFLGT
eukprot:1144307-Pelagomonas_calceolata.AAC.3